MGMTKGDISVLSGIIGFVAGAAVMTLIAINIGYIDEATSLKKECEKDLARNLKCEMVYVKPKESE